MEELKKIFFDDLSGYELGVFWGIGSYIESEKRMVLREKRKHFLKVMEEITGNSSYFAVESNKSYYVLKSRRFDIESFKENGWTSRNASERALPRLDSYKDFLRAYIELHSSLDYSIRYSGRRTRHKYKALRLRIYGNVRLIDSVNLILNNEVQVGLKSPQKTVNEITKVIYYTSLDEIRRIFEWIFEERCCDEFWSDVETKFRNPRINY